MRTTLTLDDDLAQRLKAEMRKRGLTFKEVVGQLLRRGLEAPPPPKKRFRVKARSRGSKRPSGSKSQSRQAGPTCSSCR